MDVSETTEDRISAEPSCVSMKSDRSRIMPMSFGDGQQSKNLITMNHKGPGTPEPSIVSMRSNRSRSEPIEFQGEQKNPQLRLQNRDGPVPPGPSGVSISSDECRTDATDSRGDLPLTHSAEWLTSERSEVPENQPLQKQADRCELDHIFRLLEKKMITFVQNELKKLRTVLDSKHKEKVLKEDEEVMDGEDDGRINSNRESFVNITMNLLRAMKQEELAETLHSKNLVIRSQHKLKANLKKRHRSVFEGTAKAGNASLLNKIYAELHITEGENADINKQHEVRQIEAASWKSVHSEKFIRCQDIFTPLPGREEPIRTLVTKGVAGIGKTVLTQKFILDWAEGKANQHFEFIFPFTFRELNLLKEQEYSLVELLHHIFTETKEAGICRFEDFKVLFIFDGLDESRVPLDFKDNEILTDATKSTSVNVLLTNLIRGNLLPSAQLWITTRPAAANQIPPSCVDMVTEVKGFTDPQKDEYFKKRFWDEEQADRIVSHIKTSRSVHIMCHIPVFCWITATVLEHVLEMREKAELPKTLTEMYVHFLVVQTKQGNLKYRGSDETDPVWNSESKKTIQALGKLAFEQLQKGNLIFYEEDLNNCGINIKAASVYSGLITEVFRGDHRLNEDKVFCFVHLSIHEFLAALYVFLTFINDGTDLINKNTSMLQKSKYKHLYQTAVDKALNSPNGHLDLFVRFLVGLSMEKNQTLLETLIKKVQNKPNVNEKLVQYIKKKIRVCRSPERSINLFHCLNELNDCSVVEEVQQYLRSGGVLENKLSPSQRAALVFILWSSQKHLEVFDMKKFATSDDGLQSMLPVVRASKTSLLSGCDLSWKSCEALATVFISQNSNLRELDLSNNDLCDTGVTLLSAGLGSPRCKLEVLRLSGCLITEESGASLFLALSSNPSHLKELDLSFNHPGDSAQQLLVGVSDPQWKLQTVKLDHCGESRLKPSPLRYFHNLSLDPNTANTNLCLYDNNKGVMVVEDKHSYPDHPDRFDSWKQLLCSESQTGRCYWEVHWIGKVNIGVAYGGIRRSGDSDECCVGWSDQSWGLMCTAQSFTAWHNNTATDIETPQPSEDGRVAVYLDWPAGTVSFYCFTVCSKRLIHLHTFHTTFTEPVFPAFGFGKTLDFGVDSRLLPSSVYLSQFEEEVIKS